MINDLKKRKTHFEAGIWNAESLLLGGLGNEPVPDEQNDPILKLKKSLEQTKSKFKKIDIFKKVNQADETNEEEEAKERMLKMLQNVFFDIFLL